MTKSVTITNTSNWHNEDIRVKASNIKIEDYDNNPGVEIHHADLQEVILRPGQSCSVHRLYEVISIEDSQEEKAIPYIHTNTKTQATPSVKEVWVLADGDNTEVSKYGVKPE